MMAVKIRITSNVIRPFYSEGDIVVWIWKIKVVTRLQGIVDVASLIALYLKGSALALYIKTDKEQLNAAKIKQHLRVAYTEGEHTAFAKLETAKWTAEQVDEYAVEVQRLVFPSLTGEGLEKLMLLAFQMMCWCSAATAIARQ